MSTASRLQPALDSTSPLAAHTGGVVDGDAFMRGVVLGLLVGHEHGAGEDQYRSATLRVDQSGVHLSSMLGKGHDWATWTMSLPWVEAPTSALPGDAFRWDLDLVAIREHLRQESPSSNTLLRRVGPLRLAPSGQGEISLVTRTNSALDLRGSPSRRRRAPHPSTTPVVSSEAVAHLVDQAAYASPRIGVLAQTGQKAKGVVVGAADKGGIRVRRLPADLGIPESTIGVRGLHLTGYAKRLAAEAWEENETQVMRDHGEYARLAIVTLWAEYQPADSEATLARLIGKRWMAVQMGETEDVGLDQEIALGKLLAKESEEVRSALDAILPPAGNPTLAMLAKEAMPHGTDEDANRVARLVEATRAGTRNELIGRALLARYNMPDGGRDYRSIAADHPTSRRLAEIGLRSIPVNDPAWGTVGAPPHKKPTVLSLLAKEGHLPERTPEITARIEGDGSWRAEAPLPGGGKIQVHAPAPIRAIDHPLYDSMDVILPDPSAEPRGGWQGSVLVSDLVSMVARAQAHRLFASEWRRAPSEEGPHGPVLLLTQGDDDGTPAPGDPPLLTPDAVYLGQDREAVALPVPPIPLASVRQAGLTEARLLHPSRGVVFRGAIRQPRPGSRQDSWTPVALDAATAQDLVRDLPTDVMAAPLSLEPGGVRLALSENEAVVFPTYGRRFLPVALHPALTHFGLPLTTPAHPWLAPLRRLESLAHSGAVATTQGEAWEPESEQQSQTVESVAAQKRLSAWPSVPERPKDEREIEAIARRLASGSLMTLPFPASYRRTNRALARVRNAADKVLRALGAQHDLFEAIDTNLVMDAVWADLRESAMAVPAILSEAQENPAPAVPIRNNSPQALR